MLVIAALRLCGDSPVSVRAARKAGGVGGAERGAPSPAAGFFVRPHGRRARSSRGDSNELQWPHAPRNAVVAATSCGSCWAPTCPAPPRGETSFAGRPWQQSHPNAHSGCGRARGRPTNTLGCARPHQTVGVCCTASRPDGGSATLREDADPGVWGETRLRSGSGAASNRAVRG